MKQTRKNQKGFYESPAIGIVSIAMTDIIQTSQPGGTYHPDNQGEWDKQN